jgi:hypothetical protein
LIILIIFSKNEKPWSTMQFILSPVTSYLLGPNTIGSTLFLHTPQSLLFP